MLKMVAIKHYVIDLVNVIDIDVNEAVEIWVSCILESSECSESCH